jgi:hypothetical protein
MKLALGVVTAVLATGFTCLSLEFGNGSFLRGLSEAVGYLTTYGIAFIVFAGLAATVALFAGRLIGITFTAAIGFCLLLTLTIITYLGSKPISRFRRLVWEQAPTSLSIRQHRILPSFSDGTTYTFVVGCDAQAIVDLCRAAGLTRTSKEPFAVLSADYFPSATFPAETEFFQGGNLDLAYAPSNKTAFVLYTPRR